MTTTTYRIAPSKSRDFDLAGRGNEFVSLDEAGNAAEDMDSTNPLDGDEWVVYAVSDTGRVSRA